MKPFLSEDFLLQTGTAKQLYFDHAANMPIIDYHNHLPPDEIANNKQFKNITELWLKGDHYKWRAMRSNGVNEELITGNADDFEKFKAWAETTPYTMRNPLYHWSHLELKKPFGITELLNAGSAASVYAACNEQLPQYTTQALLKYFKVDALCTTDDPADELVYHKKISEQPFGIKVLPAFRPDKAMAIDDAEAYKNYLQKLSAISGIEINSYDSLLEALHKRHDVFHEAGCRVSDHGLDTFQKIDGTAQQLENIFSKAATGKPVSKEESILFKMATLHFICTWNHEKEWVQQFHVGALRNNNTRLLKRIGADAGVDSMGDWPVAEGMAAFFDKLDKDDKLAKTIIYNNNPMYNEVFATMTGNFQDGSTPGKIQYGSGWWFLDQKDGMEKQMNTLSNMGLLSRFIGMITDSRSFLSFSRHEYFRRILCNLIGNDVENGELPADIKWLGKMVEDICYNNARDYFKL
ncbi:glucuronate isomerase [Parafilimonas terrae]|uniref:Uronate isomerase n=1 Tax=Parafilimonas terrae TaxID=1465490 RepID=A0A1I5V473_9BACT|nr:glucuronate isomerase [Parafilimonas terrae]SFQ02298.1 glucuronate isomerase [Parafilimonas terrae]